LAWIRLPAADEDRVRAAVDELAEPGLGAAQGVGEILRACRARFAWSIFLGQRTLHVGTAQTRPGIVEVVGAPTEAGAGRGERMGNLISFPRTDGTSAQGYLAEATAPDAPGVVVIQEWWGLQGQIKQVCDRLAGAGFRALAPDLFGGKVVPYHDDAAAKAAMGALDFAAATALTVRGAVQHLGRQGAKVGLTGFCMGGAVTLVGAVRIPELSAAVCFYGLAPTELAPPADIRVPLQCHFAAHDDWCTPEKVDALEQALRAAGKDYELYRYPGHHAFMNSDRTSVYDPEAAKLAWDRCLAFFEKHLRPAAARG
jgi:carboxymethylenebutenolidase